MGKLSRMNVMVDAEKLAELARRRGLRESAAVREAVEYFLQVERELGEDRPGPEAELPEWIFDGSEA